MPGARPVKSVAGSPFSVAPACSRAARTAGVTTRFCVVSVVVVVDDGAVADVVVEPEVELLVEPAGGVDCAAFGLDEHPARTSDRQAADATARSFFGAMVLLTRTPTIIRRPFARALVPRVPSGEDR